MALPEQIPCVANVNIVKLGYLDKTQTEEHLTAGAKIELPLWLVKAIVENNETVRPSTIVASPPTSMARCPIN